MANGKRNRNNQIHFYLSDEEFEKFTELKKNSGLSSSELIRRLIMNCKICNAPPVDFWDMTKQIRYYGNNMNQIAKRINLFGLPDAESYQRNADKVFEILNGILDAMLTKGN